MAVTESVEALARALAVAQGHEYEEWADLYDKLAAKVLEILNKANWVLIPPLLE